MIHAPTPWPLSGRSIKKWFVCGKMAAEPTVAIQPQPSPMSTSACCINNKASG